MNKQFYKSNMVNEGYLQNTIKYVLEEVASLMKVCYGPYGSHVLIANNIGVEAMKDGQKILSSYIPSSSIPTSIRQSLRSVSDKQAEEIGDGTTTTILLLNELYNKFRDIIDKYKVSPSVFNKKLREVVDDILSNISHYTVDVIDENGDINWSVLNDAVYTSVDGEKSLSDIIIKMYQELGNTDPLIIVDTNTSDTHRYELVKGIELDGAPISSDVFFNGYSRREMNSPKILVINGRCELSLQYLMELDNDGVRNDNDYVILCTGIDDSVLSALISAKQSNPALFNHIVFFQIRLSSTNDEFLDACAALGANPIDSETLNKITSMPALMKIIDVNGGKSEKVSMTEFCIRFSNPESKQDKIQERLDIIDEKIADLKNDPTSHNDKIVDLENRKAFLSKNYAKLYVGGSSPQRKSINYELAKDGVLQASSCLKNGVVEGCNTLIPKIVEDMDDYDDIVKTSIALTISEGYKMLFIILIANKFGYEEAYDIFESHYNEKDHGSCLLCFY